MNKVHDIDKITDIILKIAIAHHNDISKQDEDNAMECAEIIFEGCFTNRTPEDQIIACVYDCKRCEDRRYITKILRRNNEPC